MVFYDCTIGKELMMDLSDDKAIIEIVKKNEPFGRKNFAARY